MDTVEATWAAKSWAAHKAKAQKKVTIWHLLHYLCNDHSKHDLQPIHALLWIQQFKYKQKLQYFYKTVWQPLQILTACYRLQLFPSKYIKTEQFGM